jgi:hypothetical protein
VCIVQHASGERLVHHADGTRIFQSFSLEGDDVVKYEQNSLYKAPQKSLICVEHKNSPRVLIHLNKKCGISVNEWERELVTVVMPDNTILEWNAKNNKIVIQKPDNTHVHYGGFPETNDCKLTSNTLVSVYVEDPRRKLLPRQGNIDKQPLLCFDFDKGSVAVRPSRKSQVVFPTQAKFSPENDGVISADYKSNSGKKTFVAGLDGMSDWIISSSVKEAVFQERQVGIFYPSLFGQKDTFSARSSLKMSSANPSKSALATTILVAPGNDDLDSPDFLDKKIKDMKVYFLFLFILYVFLLSKKKDST